MNVVFWTLRSHIQILTVAQTAAVCGQGGISLICRIAASLTSDSKVRPVAACGLSYQARGALDHDMVLELDLDLSDSSVGCQDVHPVAVPTHFRDTCMVPQDQQRLDRFRCSLLRLDNLQHHLRLRSSPVLLESYD